jgi:5-methylcytosine-specific restriction protein A
MPNSPGTVCSTPGCGGVRHQGVCSRCGPKKRPTDQRQNAAARGYDYQWQKFRQQYLTEHPLCLDCDAEGITGAATDIHHVKKLRDHPEAKYDEQWLRPLCKRHHDQRTARGE